MDTGWLSDVGGWASAWPGALWRASWQGALCAALVWALTRAWPKMPASLRAGLWWLVTLKFVVSLGWLPAVPLPVLPASVAARVDGVVSSVAARVSSVVPEGRAEEGAGTVAAWNGQHTWNEIPATRHGAWGEVVSPARQAGGALPAQGREGEGVASPAPRRAELPVAGGMMDGPAEFSGQSAGPAGLRIAGGMTDDSVKRSDPSSRMAELPVAGGMADDGVKRSDPSSGAAVQSVAGGMAGDPGKVSGPSVTSPASAGFSSTWSRALASLLLAAWVTGVLWQLRSHVLGWARMRRLRLSARPLVHPVLESEVHALSSTAKLWRVPKLLVSESVVSPLATGLVDPVVVLPAKAVRRLPVEALRMALAHELAHLRRGDLWLGWVPALAEALLFFHPLARRAAREYALAREEACDAEALRLTGAEPADYGELLLAFGVARGAGTAAAHGASAHVHALHRRLSMLEHVEAVPTRSRRLLKVALSALGLAALVPFQVVRRSPREAVLGADFIASTATRSLPLPVSITTAGTVPGWRACSSRSRPMPVIPGRW
ncbi:M56 family metallopeptidase [Pyxidicoccus sp. 3LFB2]